MKRRTTFASFSLFAGVTLCILCAGAGALCAQTAVISATATIDFGNNQSVTANSNGTTFDRVGLQPNQVVDVTVQLSPVIAGRTIIVEPLDGGRVIGPASELVVAADGTFSFRFQAGGEPGIYQVTLHDGAQEIGLQFWVLDPQNPQNNPQVLTPSTPNI